LKFQKEQDVFVEHHFRAMNTDVGVWLWSASPVAERTLREVEQMFVEVESQLSRFRADSDLCRLNDRAGQGAISVSPLLTTVLAQALKAARKTEGIFDPTLLPQLQQAGYDRSFELLDKADERNAKETICPISPGWQQIRLDQANGTVELPTGTAIDLGGIAKGWTVDQASELLASWGPSLVDAGGDMRARGLPGGAVWPVGVEDPFSPDEQLMTLGLENCAVATSTVGKRTWQRNGQRFHHLIDPRTGQSSASGLHTVTVLASSATEAEVAAKTALVLGSVEGTAWLRCQGNVAILIRRSGDHMCVGQLHQWKRDEQ
jgi:thiamine biosynthesis lipoprotein